MTTTACTILMLSVDEAALLEHSLPPAMAQPGARVIVIDNACADGTAALCDRYGVQTVKLRARASYAAAINAGLAATSDEAVLLLNADCVLDAGFLAAALPRLADEPAIGSVAPRLVRATGMSPDERLDVLDAAGMTVDRRRKNRLVGHGEPWRARGTPGDCFGPDGACALYRREVLDAVAVGAEVLDEDMALWATDVDLAWRARGLGWRSVYEPAAIAWHKRFYSPSTRARTSAEHRRIQYRNRYLMIVKNDRRRDLLRDAPLLLAWELLALGHVLARERDLLPAYADALRLLGGARRRRRAARARPPFGLEPPGRCVT